MAEKARAAAESFGQPVKVFTDLGEALGMEGVDAVDVALPILPASGAIEAALRRGLHVFSEKPIAESVERARALMLGEITEVSAFARGVDPEIPPLDTMVASLVFDSGVIANYSASYALEMERMTRWGLARSVFNGAMRRMGERFGASKPRSHQVVQPATGDEPLTVQPRHGLP